MKSLNHRKSQLNSYARYSSIAIQMIVIILAGVFGGIKLDEWLKLNFPVFTVILSFLAVILAIYYVTKDLIRGREGNTSTGKGDRRTDTGNTKT